MPEKLPNKVRYGSCNNFRDRVIGEGNYTKENVIRIEIGRE